MQKPTREPEPLSFSEIQTLERNDFSLEDIEQAQEALVSELEGKLGDTRRVDDEIMALCPYHNDQSLGSFYLNSSTGQFHCWSCGAGGGLPKLMRRLKVLPSTYSLGEVPLRFVLDNLAANTGGLQIAPEVDDLRELPEEALDGFAPLTSFRGHLPELLSAMEVGYDPEYRRIVFPVRDYSGRLLGIQSRATNSWDTRRWKFYKSEFSRIIPWREENYSSLLNYAVPRSSCFYGESKCWSWFSRGGTKPLVLCEGPGHWLRIVSAGYPALATFGTAVSKRQLRRLKDAIAKTTNPTIILCYDGDNAGRRATDILSGIFDLDVDTRIAELPSGKDPEDLQVAELKEVLLHAQRAAIKRVEEGLDENIRTYDRAEYEQYLKEQRYKEEKKLPSKYWVFRQEITHEQSSETSIK